MFPPVSKDAVSVVGGIPLPLGGLSRQLSVNITNAEAPAEKKSLFGFGGKK